MILVKPNAGLANRINAIHSTILLANLVGINEIKVIWKKYSGLNANFTDLFLPIEGCVVEESLLNMAFLFYFNKKINKYKYYDDMVIKKHRYDIDFWKETPSNTIINTCLSFLSPYKLENLYCLFRPKTDIQKSIDKIINKFNSQTVGVQIRRTGSGILIKERKLEDFAFFMEMEIKKQPTTDFFLATDDIESEQYLKQQFPDKIIVQEGKDLSRNSLRGIKDALVDMYALSATKYILGSYKSSFGEVASYIGQIPFITVRR